MSNVDSKEYLAYMTKLRLCNVDKCVRILNVDGRYILKKVKYSYELSNFSIPDFIDELADGCCSGTRIRSVSLGRNVTTVGYGCFANCNELVKIKLYVGQESMIPSLVRSNSAIIEVIERES